MSRAQPLRDPTYYDDIQPLVAQRCVKCHSPGGVGPFPLTSYEEVSPRASLMSNEVTARRMPPWSAQSSDECAPPFGWQGDERLTEDEIDLIRRWAALDAPAGNVPTSTVAILGATDPGNLFVPTIEVAPKDPYLPRTEGDDFRCFVMDVPELEAGAWLSGVDVVPGDRRIVHHATVWADPDGVGAAKAGPDGSLDCSEADALPMGLWWVISWAPGAKPLELPPDVAIEIPPRSKLIMQIHYSVGQREIVAERTRLRLRVAESRPKYALNFWQVGNWGAAAEDGEGLFPGADDATEQPEFRIPAWKSDHVETMTNRMRDATPLILYGIRAHAHLAATDIKIDRLHVDTPEEAFPRHEREQCLLQDRWDFHWQRVYSYDTPVASLPRIQPGDRIRMRCTYDNTMTNRRLGLELHERGLQPTDILLGGATLEEMCLADLFFLRPLE